MLDPRAFCSEFDIDLDHALETLARERNEASSVLAMPWYVRLMVGVGHIEIDGDRVTRPTTTPRGLEQDHLDAGQVVGRRRDEALGQEGVASAEEPVP